MGRVGWLGRGVSRWPLRGVCGGSGAGVADNRGMPTASVTPGTAPGSRCATRVVLADDDVLLREGLASLLDRSGFEVAGQAGNGTELLALVRSARPELAIIDIRMPPAQATEGLQAARVIREELPGTAIIVLSAHVEVDEAMELLAGGERLGYLLKSRVTDVAEFIETVERITAGASVVDPSLVQELVRARRRRDPLDVLSPREREVLALMAEGASNAGIARRIFVTEGTVEKARPQHLDQARPARERQPSTGGCWRFCGSWKPAEAEAMAEFPASRNAAAPYPGHSDRMPLRCLLVDDNEAFLETASVLLEREGLAVVGLASSIAEALRQARALRPDLILVDIGLGDESGFDLARLLAQDNQGGPGGRRRRDLDLHRGRSRLPGPDRRQPGRRIPGQIRAIGAGHQPDPQPHPVKPHTDPGSRQPGSVSPHTQDWHTAQPAQRVRVTASRNSAGPASRGPRWASAVWQAPSHAKPWMARAERRAPREPTGKGGGPDE